MATKKAKEYWIVNPHGTLHQVNRGHAQELLKKVGYRMATPAEIKKAKTPNRKTADGKDRIVQTYREPFGKPFTPVEDLDALEEAEAAEE